jgi:flagellin-specific chaperone FliS
MEIMSMIATVVLFFVISVFVSGLIYGFYKLTQLIERKKLLASVTVLSASLETQKTDFEEPLHAFLEEKLSLSKEQADGLCTRMMIDYHAGVEKILQGYIYNRFEEIEDVPAIMKKMIAHLWTEVKTEEASEKKEGAKLGTDKAEDKKEEEKKPEADKAEEKTDEKKEEEKKAEEGKAEEKKPEADKVEEHKDEKKSASGEGK